MDIPRIFHSKPSSTKVKAGQIQLWGTPMTMDDPVCTSYTYYPLVNVYITMETHHF